MTLTAPYQMINRKPDGDRQEPAGKALLFKHLHLGLPGVADLSPANGPTWHRGRRVYLLERQAESVVTLHQAFVY